MNNPDDLIKELEKPEVKEIMEKNKRKNEKIKGLMETFNYINWLINFTKDKESFTDDYWDYSSEKLSEYDKEMVRDLSLFFEVIYLYAKNNYIYSSPRSLGEYYQIKLNDNIFEIGYITGQGTSFYCRKLSKEEEDKAIDFIDIITNKKQDNKDYIENRLTSLSNLLINLYNNGIPLEAIENTINKTMHNIEINEEKGKVKSKRL